MKNGKKSEQKMTAILLSMGLCVVALGAGVTYYTWSNVQEQPPQETAQASPATAAKTPTLETAQLQREERSKDDGESPDAGTEVQTIQSQQPKTSAQQPVTEEMPEAVLTFSYPVSREIVMPYSVDQAIYDPTLEQYRTNDTLCIAAAEGTAVQAAADGVVAEIRDDDEAGKTLVVEHADGWRTTYSPLAEDGLPQTGEAVTKGQTLGSLDQPTKYQAGLGSHLEFSMEQNGNTVDPQTKLNPQESAQ